MKTVELEPLWINWSLQGMCVQKLSLTLWQSWLDLKKNHAWFKWESVICFKYTYSKFLASKNFAGQMRLKFKNENC